MSATGQTQDVLGRRALTVLSAVMLVIVIPESASAQAPLVDSETGQAGYASGAATLERDPGDIEKRLLEDDESVDPLIPTPRIDKAMSRWYRFKANLDDRFGFKFDLSYSALAQRTDRSRPNKERDAAGGVAEFLGTWTLLRRSSDWEGKLGFRFNNQHRLGTSIPPDDLGEEIGSFWGTSNGFGEETLIPAELWWEQKVGGDRIRTRVGKVDFATLFDPLTLGDSFTGFVSEPFAEDTTIAFPDEGFGIGAQVQLRRDLQVLGGVGNANKGVRSFFERDEYLKIAELSRTPQIYGLGKGGYSIQVWQSDERVKAKQSKGQGIALSGEQSVGAYLPFFRASHASGGATSVKNNVAVGVGAREMFGRKSDVLGLGVSWGEAFKRDQRDQYGFEAYYRLQLTKEMTLTPDLQVAWRPAGNPREDRVIVTGIRVRKDL